MPNILLSAKNDARFYVDAVKGCGGTCCVRYLADSDFGYDGLILCGGGDTHPSFYGEQVNGSVDIDLPRDRAELMLLDAFIKEGKPILGICRGFQLINIYFGGTLEQDIENAKEHTSFESVDLIHPVKAQKGSVCEKLYGEDFYVNSSHHQALKKTGNNISVTAYSYDGVAEAIEHMSLPVFGVQWHPERMCFNRRRQDTVDGKYIFEHFLNICRAKKH